MSEQNPFFSIIVPTYGRPRQLRACLGALAALAYPRECFEVIVVDDGGGLGEGAVEPFRASIEVMLLSAPHGGPAAARNAGARRARGRVLAFTDDDCAPDAGWLASLAARLAHGEDALVGGRIVNALPRNAFSEASQLLVEYLYTRAAAGSDAPAFFCTNNLAVPAERFRELGGFDETFTSAAGEDREFCDRWRTRGLRLAYAPEAVVRHAHPLTPRGFCRQHFNYGRAAFAFRRARARRGAGGLRVEPLPFYLDLLRYPFARERGPRALPLAGLFFVSQLANAAGFFYERARGRRS
jgi:GT2 family glycosyltransferase